MEIDELGEEILKLEREIFKLGEILSEKKKELKKLVGDYSALLDAEEDESQTTLDEVLYAEEDEPRTTLDGVIDGAEPEPGAIEE